MLNVLQGLPGKSLVPEANHLDSLPKHMPVKLIMETLDVHRWKMWAGNRVSLYAQLFPPQSECQTSRAIRRMGLGSDLIFGTCCVASVSDLSSLSLVSFLEGVSDSILPVRVNLMVNVSCNHEYYDLLLCTKMHSAYSLRFSTYNIEILLRTHGMVMRCHWD